MLLQVNSCEEKVLVGFKYLRSFKKYSDNGSDEDDGERERKALLWIKLENKD